MKYTHLGQTDLYVSRIALGLWQAGGDWGAVDGAAETATIRRALDLGINFFDTAQAYGFGASERLLGAALGDKIRGERGKIVIATKGGLRQTGNGLVRDASPAWLRKGIEESLRALGTEWGSAAAVKCDHPRRGRRPRAPRPKALGKRNGSKRVEPFEAGRNLGPREAYDQNVKGVSS